MEGLEWIIEAPIHRILQPYTVYYFTEGGKTVKDIINYISPTHPARKPTTRETLVEWLEWADGDGGELKYFVLDENMDIRGWCDETTLEECKNTHHPEPEFSYVSIDEFF
jgi:hypothetical protein